MPRLDVIENPFLTPSQGAYLDEVRSAAATSDRLFTEGASTGEIITSLASSALGQKIVTTESGDGPAPEPYLQMLAAVHVEADLKIAGVIANLGIATLVDAMDHDTAVERARNLSRFRRDNRTTFRMFASGLATGQIALSSDEPGYVNPWEIAREVGSKLDSKVTITGDEADYFVSHVPDANAAIMAYNAKLRETPGKKLPRTKLGRMLKAARSPEFRSVMGQAMSGNGTGALSEMTALQASEVTDAFSPVTYDDTVAATLQGTLDRHYLFLRHGAKARVAIAEDPRARMVAYAHHELPTMRIGEEESKFLRAIHKAERTRRKHVVAVPDAPHLQIGRKSGDPRPEEE